MNSASVAPTWFETFHGHICRILHSYARWIPCLRRQHQVHPVSTNAGRNKFLQLGPQRRIRIVHIDSKKLSNGDSLCRKPFAQSKHDRRNSETKPCEISEDDYWFTRWTQPLKISNNCNCSFKRKRTLLQDPASYQTPRVNGGVANCNEVDVSKRVYDLRVDCTDTLSPLDVSRVRAFAADLVRTVLEDAVTHVSLSGPNETYASVRGDEGRDRVLAVDGEAGQGRVNLSFVCDPPTPTPKACSHATRRARKPLLYFLHGVGSSADVWWGLLRFFVSAGYEVLAPDMLGHGYSSAPDRESAYTFQRLLKDAVDVFDRFVGENGKCVVVGHSYGCSLAAAVARHRTQVSHLVLISGGGPTPLAPSQQPPMFPGLRGCVEAFLVCGFKRDALYAPCGKQMTSCAASGQRHMPQYVLRHMARGQDWPEGDSTFHRRILVPTLLVHGMRDTHVTLVQECEMERTIPRSFLELIPNAGHLAMLETPAQLSHMINCFIEWWSR